MLAPRAAQEDSAQRDHIVVLHEVRWSDYERVLAIRGDRPVPRISYLAGELELMSPSQTHEGIKSRIGHLVEVWCLENAVEFDTFGSWTLKRRKDEAGAEPDECYVFGSRSRMSSARRPDLAIEVVWTSGGVDKLEIYRRLGVREVWFWNRAEISVHILHGSSYRQHSASKVLPGIDLDQLATFLALPASEAIRAYRAALQRG